MRGVLTPRRFARTVLVFVVMAMLALGAAYFYARSQRGIVADGVRVGAIDLGDQSAAAAQARLVQAYRPLRRPLVLRYGNKRLVVTAPEAEVSIDTDGIVRQALALSGRGWFFSRAWRELTGEKLHATLSPRVDYSRLAIERTVREVHRRMDHPAANAVLVASFDRLTVERGHHGIEVAAGPLRRQIATTLVTPRARRVIEVPILHPRPRVTVAVLRRRYPSFITIDRAGFRLRLFRYLRLVRSYPIAVGQQGLQTPAGIYHIQDKVVNPSWQVPFSAWTGPLAGRLIPPGPDDPLKARWMGIFNGAGIHGTDETWSIGHAVSHGCVRMTIPDVIDLYNQVSVGTPRLHRRLTFSAES
jgi:lipoprotein-anchoring transpeptidase ErfK/SrfK